MTSGKSFWANLLKNNIQRLWMWIVSVLVFVVSYPVMLFAYFNRTISAYGYEVGPMNMANFVKDMKEAVCDCLGYNTVLIFYILAGFFAIGIFAYLNNKSKMDMLWSLPVSAKKIFLGDYISGILMCVIPYLVFLGVTLVIAVLSGYMTRLALQEMLFAMFLNMVIFVMYYSLAVLCVCITGNLVIATGAYVSLSFAFYITFTVIEDLKGAFFKTTDWMFNGPHDYFTPIADYINRYYQLKEANNIVKEIRMLGARPVLWFVLAVVMVILAYISFIKRPVEAHNKICYSRWIRIAVKIYLGIAGTISGVWVLFGNTGDNKIMFALGLAAGGLIIGMAFEALYDLDIKSVFKSIGSTAVIIAVCMCVFLYMKFDIFGYDRYVPSKESVESYAIDLNPTFYMDVFDYELDETTGKRVTNWYTYADYYKEHMFITDIDAISQLAKKCADNKLYDLAEDIENNNIQGFSVHYRKKNGMTINRRVYVDMNDEESRTLINRIASTMEWKKGYFQIIDEEEFVTDTCTKIVYQDGVHSYVVKASAKEMIDLYVKDLEKFDYKLGVEEYPVGILRLELDNYNCYNLPVYAIFSGVINKVSMCDGYTGKSLDADDVSSIRITNYHSEFWEENREDVAYNYTPEVTIVVTDKARIKEIVEASCPSMLSKFWVDNNSYNGNYSVDIFLDADSGDFRKGDCVSCYFKDTVPNWVIDESAMQ